LGLFFGPIFLLDFLFLPALFFAFIFGIFYLDITLQSYL
jgi:hypothetical protein